ncbi:MAG TPA: alkaline phosphatase family protein [Patescibacteria group bacterium]|nr:alkaline phosphatase family protein [Patescibacteria group bacterium]
MEQTQKVIVIGLDCATPQLVFDAYKNDLPNIASCMEQGTWGEMTSTIPPITVPAWMSMMTSKTPGDLGVYGFRSRKAGSDYHSMDIATGRSITEKKLWEYLGDAGKKVGLLGVPQTYPPTPVNGHMVTCFLTPNTSVDFTYPASLKKEILDLVAPEDYIFDFANRSKEPPEKVLETIYTMTNQRQKIMRDWIKNKEWDFLMMVEMGVDRIHHYLWQYIDSTHKDYLPGNPFEEKIRHYYQYIDQFIGELKQLAPKDTIFYIVSDHGAKRMDGMFVINEWLMDNGYLTLKKYPEKPTSIEQCEVDWSKTKAWAWGGFYSRLFINVKGREPQGIVEPSAVDALLEELRSQLLNVKGPKGETLKHRIYRSSELYQEPKGDVPELLVFWGDLYWKVAGTIGYNQHYIDHDDRGLDYGVHDWKGIFVKYDPKRRGSGKREDISILDVTPTILHDFGCVVPQDMRGKVL